MAGAVLFYPAWQWYTVLPRYESQAGGKGSFDFADTSRYSPGHVRDNDNQGRFVIPGGGGGATINRRAPGSIFGMAGAGDKPGRLTTPGVSPHGCVVIRLTS